MRKYPPKENGVDHPDIFRGFCEKARKNLREATITISDAFSWRHTAEGDVFWSSVVNRLRQISEMPDPALKTQDRPFKPGDRVVCVDAHKASCFLEVGKIYTIAHLSRLGDGRPSVFLKEHDANWLVSRFRHADQALPAMWLGADAFPEENAA